MNESEIMTKYRLENFPVISGSIIQFKDECESYFTEVKISFVRDKKSDKKSQSYKPWNTAEYGPCRHYLSKE